jgi:hypothetical protein
MKGMMQPAERAVPSPDCTLYRIQTRKRKRNIENKKIKEEQNEEVKIM